MPNVIGAIVLQEVAYVVQRVSELILPDFLPLSRRCGCHLNDSLDFQASAEPLSPGRRMGAVVGATWAP